jgi:hypothetical protein
MPGEYVDSYDIPISIEVRYRGAPPRRDQALPVPGEFCWQVALAEFDSLRLTDISLKPLRAGYRSVAIQDLRLLYWRDECVVESWYEFQEVQQFWRAEVTSNPRGTRIDYLDSSKIINASLSTPPLEWKTSLPIDIFYNSAHSYEFVLNADSLALSADSTIKHDRDYIKRVVEHVTTEPRNLWSWGRAEALMAERQITINEIRFKLKR